MRGFFAKRDHDAAIEGGQAETGDSRDMRTPAGVRRRQIDEGDEKFASFERLFYGFVGFVVLAGAAILFMSPQTIDLAGEQPQPQTIVAMPSAAPTPSAPEALKKEAKAPVAPAKAEPAVALLSKTRVRDSAKEALAAAAPLPSDARAAAEETPVVSAAAPLAYASPAADVADASEHTTRCFVKVAGRVLGASTCKVSRKGQAITLQTGGSSLTIAPQRGREWLLTLAGRPVGKVYRSGGCWGSNNRTWICEKGV